MVNKNDDWHRERRVGKAVKAGIKCFCGSEAYRDILEVTMNCETFPRVHRIFCPNCGLQMRSPAGNDDNFIVRQWRDISDLHQHRKAQESRVMTLAEAKSASGYVIVQSRSCNILELQLIKDGFVYDSFTVPIAVDDLWWEGYNKHWRLWTSVPTDAQREKVKWDG